MSISRCGAAVLTAGVGLICLAPLTAAADGIEVADADAPVVGMAYAPGSSDLWIAGARADDGIIVNAETGDEVTFGGDPVSVQALAWRSSRLYIADIGDPDASRDHVVVFRLASTQTGRQTYNAFDFQYADGAQDAKAFMISARGNLYVVTAGDDPGIYYSAAQPSRTSMNTLTRVADAPDGVTDGVFLKDGSTMALRTDVGIEYIDAFTWETLVTDTIVGAPENESIAVGANDEIYVGGNPEIRTTEVPSSDTTTTVAPSASPSSSASASPSPSASESAATVETEDQVEDDSGSSPTRTGTYVAIGLAALLSVAAGVVTWLVRN